MLKSWHWVLGRIGEGSGREKESPTRENERTLTDRQHIGREDHSGGALRHLDQACCAIDRRESCAVFMMERYGAWQVGHGCHAG